MAGVNKVILLGYLGKDPEIRYVRNGVAVANFSLATTEVYKDKNTGDRRGQTEWHNIVLWSELAEIAEKYLKKGDMVYIEGKLKSRSWEKDGITRYATDIVGNNITMLGARGRSSSSTSQEANHPPVGGSSQDSESIEDTIDDLPF